MIKLTLQQKPQAFVEKSDSIANVKQAVDTVSKGGSFFSARASALLYSLGEATGKARLTLRESEIIQMIAEGFTTKEIATNLGTAEKTIENHRSNLMQKLDLHNVAAITRYAIRNHIISA